MRNTKALIAGAFSQLLEEKPYRRITVRDIVERCGVNRNTFYRYYPDIPSLLQAIVQEKGDWLIENYCQQGQPLLCIRPLIQYSLDHRRAVLHVYRSLPREEFQAGLARITGYLVEGYFQKAGEGLAIPPENRAFLTRFYRCAMMGVSLDWLEGGMETDLLAEAEFLCRLMEQSGQQSLLLGVPPEALAEPSRKTAPEPPAETTPD